MTPQWRWDDAEIDPAEAIKALGHLIFFGIIVVSIYLVHGAWRGAFASKSYAVWQRYLPSFLPRPKSLAAYTVAHKVIAVFPLLLSLAMYALFIAGLLQVPVRLEPIPPWRDLGAVLWWDGHEGGDTGHHGSPGHPDHRF